MNNHSCCLAVTAGEPAGIGPDLCIQLAHQNLPGQLVVIADSHLLLARAEELGLDIELEEFTPTQPGKVHVPGVLTVLDVPLSETAVAGQLNKANVSYVLNTLDQAIDGCLDGVFDALVTGPIHKGIINEALGATNDKAIDNTILNDTPLFTGHTEYLAERTACPLPVMMLATAGLRVALVTTHLPLSRVAENITADRLRQVIEVLHQALVNHFGLSSPTILVCGLNPHAGEDGHLGREELDIIIPVLDELRQRGWRLQGPLPADTLFVADKLQQADAVLAMYHDQGLPVLKHMGFGQAVNITLGLPIIRTSVDHGVALDLAGSGQAKVSSLKLAVNTAVEMVKKSVNSHDKEVV